MSGHDRFNHLPCSRILELEPMGSFMKVLTAIAVLIVLLAAYGLITPTITHRFELRIERPLMPTFVRLFDPMALPQWVDGLQNVEPKHQGFHLPGMPASAYTLTYERGAISNTFDMVITDVEVLQRIDVLLAAETFELKCNAALRPDGDDTIIDLQVEGKGKSLFTKILLPYVRSRMKEESEGSFRNFKALVEKE